MKAVAGLLLLSMIAVPAWAPPRQELDPGYWQRSILPQMGIATYYAPGLMEYVVDYRTRHGQLPPCEDCVGAVALLRAGDIGRKVWLQPPGGELAGPFLVVDCARPEDIPPLLDRNWAVDVSYELGQTWGLAGPLDGVIVWADPAEGNAPAPPALPTQFYIDPREVIISAPTRPGAALPTVPLPTRLPGPRGAPTGAPRVSAPPATPQVVGPPPLTSIITTPTPLGYRVPEAATPVRPHGTTAAPPELRVALGRPGEELLLAAARPAPVPSPFHTAPASPTLAVLAARTSTPASTPVVTSQPVRATATPTPVPAAEPSINMFQRFWRGLLGLLGH